MNRSEENKVIIDGQTYYGGLNQPNLKFIKVNVDCWEKIFDFLALSDILAMSQTCQRMRQIGGHYFRENFSGTPCDLSGSSGFHISIGGKPIDRVDFLRFIDTVAAGGDLEYLRNLSSMDMIGSLTALCLWHINLIEHQLDGLEGIKTKIETIELSKCFIGDKSVGEFLASCLKLKSLRFKWVNFKSKEIKANFFQRTYPMLEYFEYTRLKKMIQLVPFLHLNPTIHSFQIESEHLRVIPLQTSTVQLDYLNVDIRKVTNFHEFLNRLKTLHANGVYKKLRLSIEWLPDDFDGEMFFREMISFDALEVLNTFKFYTHAMSQLTQLKELRLLHYDDFINLETMAVNLINLERLSIGMTVDLLLPFLRHSKKLKFVIFYDRNQNRSTFSLFKLNETRRMGGMRGKVRIGLSEDQYLRIKWKENSVAYDLVEITRVEMISKYFFCEN